MNKLLLFLILVVIVSCKSRTQEQRQHKDDVWVSYYDSVSELSGYKDSAGNVKIPARFNIVYPPVFKNIIGVWDSNNTNYYLLKSGRKVGIDSVYMFDFTPDFETEGKIIFRDKITYQVGFFDSNGQVIISAVYDHAYPFHNNITAVHKGGKLVYSDDHEHSWWTGGKSAIINEKNKILVDSLDWDYLNLDPIGIIVSSSVDSTRYVSNRGQDGKVYSFPKRR